MTTAQQPELPRFVAVGETMALLSARRSGPLRFTSQLRLGFGGSEANVAIGVSRLGVPAAWLGRVGDDEFGRMIVAGLRAEAVDVTGVTVDHEQPTALMVRERRTEDLSRVIYYRRGLAGSRLSPAHIDEGMLSRAEMVHVSAITVGLSHTARDAVSASVDIGRAAGAIISADLNYRTGLWRSPDEAAGAMSELAARADIVQCSAREAAMVTSETSPEAAARALASLGPTEVLVKLGAAGAVALVDGDLHPVAPVPVTEVDPVGAGDGFAAGYLSARVLELPTADRLHRAAVAGALVAATDGDWEGLPRLGELDLLRSPDGVQR